MSDMPRRDFIQTSATGLLMIVPHLLADGAATQGASATAGQDLCFMSATALAAAIGPGLSVRYPPVINN